MSYLKLPLVPPLSDGLQATETLVVQIDLAHRVAVGIEIGRDPVTQWGVYRVRARKVDANGQTEQDAHGHAITTECSHAMTNTAVLAIGVDNVLRSLSLLALGEPTPLMTFSADMQRDASIRTAIAMASRVGVAAGLAALL